MEDLNDKVTSNSLTATEWNQVPSEIQNVIEDLGITLSAGDLDQLGKGIAGYVSNGNSYTDSGSADAYVLSTIGSKQSLPAYVDGDEFFYVAANANTGGAATANIAGLGATGIKLRGGTVNPPADHINTTQVTRLIYRSSPSAHLELDRTGRKITTHVTASDATWTPQPDTKTIRFAATGGGGGGGGVDGQGVNTTACSIAGAGGGTSTKQTHIIDPTYNITIGTGGTGGAAGNNAGTAGTATTVVGSVGPGTNMNLSAPGGAGGVGDLGSSTSAFLVGAAGGTGATGGDANWDGGDSTSANSGSARFSGSSSGVSIYGGSKSPALDATGLAATNPGAGGGSTTTANVATNYAGGDGADGIVIVDEWL